MYGPLAKVEGFDRRIKSWRMLMGVVTMKKLLWVAIALIPPVISVILTYHQRPGLGMVLDAVVLAFCALVILLVLPIWGGWRNFNRADTNQFQDFVMEPFGLMFTGTKNPNPPKLLVTLSTVVQIGIAAIPSIAGLAFAQHMAVQQGWDKIKSELTVNNISVIENKSSIAVITTPHIRQEFVDNLRHAQIVATQTGMFELSSSNYLIMICKDGFQIALINLGNNGAFSIVNEGQFIRHATQYTIHSKSLEQWYNQMIAKATSRE